MKSRYIKLPNGKLKRCSPDKLKLFLAQNAHLASVNEEIFDFAIKQASGKDMTRYDTDTFDIDKLAGYEIVLCGAGSVGSHLLYCLGPAKLITNIIDPKDVELKHTYGGRTIYDPTLIGLPKVEAMKRKLERDFLGTKVNPLPFDVGEIPAKELQAMFARPLVVISAIDDPKQILRISDLAYPMVEFIQVAMHAGAKSGHIAVSIPFVTPCLRCTLDIKDSGDIHQLHSEPANSWDIMTVAQQAARIAVDIMYSKVTGQEITRWDTSKNLIYIANTRQQLSPDGPGIHFESSQRRPGCPVCNSSNIPPERRYPDE